MRTQRIATLLLGGLLLCVLVAAPGCGRKKDQVRINPDLAGGTQAGFGAAETTTGEGLPDVNADKLLWSKATGLETIYFDFDDYSLTPQAREALRRNADKIKQVPGAIIQIEGHCDERGTQQYNLALGERRALAVREYLIMLGVSGDRLITISYGEEVPAVLGSNEAAWAKNRRVEFNKAS